MSEYYLADQTAEERAQAAPERDEQPAGTPKSQDVKVTLLGDFLFPTGEPQGFDPYNHVHGKIAARQRGAPRASRR